jgi:hypothetical protein
MRGMAEYSYLVLHLPRGTPGDVARRILADHAEYGDWELARLRLNPDGSRKATLRRQIISAGSHPALTTPAPARAAPRSVAPAARYPGSGHRPAR